MTDFFADVDSWLTAALLAALMVAGWAIGLWRGQRLAKQGYETPESKFNDASLALLGLLLGFTFSMSLTKHDQRRQMVVTDSNAIGDFYTCASLLKEPVRTKLQGAIRSYLEHRLNLTKDRLDEVRIQQKLAEVQTMHNRMQELVAEALRDTPIAVPLVNTLNGVTSSHAARVAAFRDRLPVSIAALLFLAAILSMELVGKRQGALGQGHAGATFGFAMLVSMVVWVTLDLNQPNRGFITVSQEPLQRLLTGMGK